MKRPLLILAAVAALALAAVALLRPEAPSAPPPPVEAVAERPALRHRLADAGWRLVQTREPGEDRRVTPPVALIGGAEIEAPSWYLLIRAVYPISAETRAQYPDRDFTGQVERGECGGILYAGGSAGTAAHCLLARDGSAPLWLEVCVQPSSRSSCRAHYILHRAAVDLDYEPDGAAGYRSDRGLILLPEDPGGGAPLPQTARVELEPGETLHVFAMGSDVAGELSERVKTCAQRVEDVRRTIIETVAPEDCRIRRADSGSPAGRIVGGEFVQTATVSSYDPRDEARNFYAPLRPDRIRAALEAFSERADL